MSKSRKVKAPTSPFPTPMLESHENVAFRQKLDLHLCASNYFQSVEFTNLKVIRDIGSRDTEYLHLY